MSLGASIPPPHAILTDALIVLFELAAEKGRKALAAHARRRDGRKPPRGLTLRPGPETPLWNEVRSRLRRYLEHRGAKALLAREIGLPRQRINEFIHESSAMPDAERTLLILAWLLRQERDHPIIGDPRPTATTPPSRRRSKKQA